VQPYQRRKALLVSMRPLILAGEFGCWHYSGGLPQKELPLIRAAHERYSAALRELSWDKSIDHLYGLVEALLLAGKHAELAELVEVRLVAARATCLNRA
jgi:hypothetical protein